MMYALVFTFSLLYTIPTVLCQSTDGFSNPASAGGSFLTKVQGTSPEGLGEPINLIISANSDKDVLQDSDSGLQNYFRSLNFSSECLNQHFGNSQQANLGDGNDYHNETAVRRYNFGLPYNAGTCTESFQGGNHFRYWVQKGSSANTGAVFMAASMEKSAQEGHDIIINGYNLGRDLIVGNISGSAIDSSSLSSSSSFSGSTTGLMPDNKTTTSYTTKVQYLSGLLNKGSDGINHASTVGVNGQPAVDGLVAVLTVSVSGHGTTNGGSNGSNNQSNEASRVASGALIPIVIAALATIFIY